MEAIIKVNGVVIGKVKEASIPVMAHKTSHLVDWSKGIESTFTIGKSAPTKLQSFLTAMHGKRNKQQGKQHKDHNRKAFKPFKQLYKSLSDEAKNKNVLST